MKHDIEERKENFLPAIAENLDIQIGIPGATVVREDDSQDKSLYYIYKCRCVVTVRNDRLRDVEVRKLNEGDHFGEISLIYGCERTATVTATNYNTFAVLSSPAYHHLTYRYPEYEECLKSYIVEKYDDRRTSFIEEMIKSVEYMKEVPDYFLSEMIFNLKLERYEKDDYLLIRN